MRFLGWVAVMLGLLVTSQAGPNKEKIPPGVVLESNPKPLVELVTGMLKNRDDCVVRFTRRGDGEITLHRWELDVPKKLKLDVKPMVLTLNKGIEINDGPAMERLTVPELDQRLGMWKAAVGDDDRIARVRIRVEKGASDALFREMLHSLRKAGLDSHLYVETFKREKSDGD